ncbi:Uridine phosphorylase [bioreactor metagenome]|uniref:Uridine phosphorylase n=1 Tax=bioreactor metagenome TaxID=1076179 RepID=A0A645DD93_9ZZZZ
MSENTLQHHIQCREGDVAKYVLLPGSPERALKIAQHLDEFHEVARHREYAIFTGKKDGIDITVSSTGMGCPSTAICVEELGKIGADTFIRVGSAGGMQEEIHSGSIVIYTAAWRDDGTSAIYIPLNYPAVADRHVVAALEKGAQQLNIQAHVGLGASGDAFYAKKPAGSTEMKHDANILAGEMEASALFVVSALRGWRAGCIVAIDGNIYLNEKKKLGTEHLFREAEETEILIALEAVKILYEQDKAKS